MNRKIPVFVFFLPALLLLLAGMLPMFKGGEINATFVALAAFWMIVPLAILNGKKKPESGGDQK